MKDYEVTPPPDRLADRGAASHGLLDGAGDRQLPTSKLVGLSVGLPSVALPARKPHASDFLIRGFLR